MSSSNSGIPDPVDKTNWQDAENVGWSFQHVNEILDTEPICRGSGVATPLLPAGPVRVPDAVGGLDVSLVEGTCKVSDIIAATETDGWMVLHRDQVVVEEYFGGMKPETRHLLMSVSKSLTATVAGALVSQKKIDPKAPATRYVPELAGCGYAGATVRQLLDMRSGIKFSEKYHEDASEVKQMEAAAGWALPRDDTPDTLKGFLLTLVKAQDHKNGPFEYRSCETAVLGWICEAVTDTPFPQLASELLWSKLGAEDDAYITVDAEGTAAFDGGFCATLRDMARFGAMIRDNGRNLSGMEVVPKSWVDDIINGGSRNAFERSPDNAHDIQMKHMHDGKFRNMFWFPEAGDGVVLCIGVHGQLIYINRDTGTVGVKLSSWPTAKDYWSDDQKDHWKGFSAVWMFNKISDYLANSGTP